MDLYKTKIRNLNGSTLEHEAPENFKLIKITSFQIILTKEDCNNNINKILVSILFYVEKTERNKYRVNERERERERAIQNVERAFISC